MWKSGGPVAGDPRTPERKPKHPSIIQQVASGAARREKTWEESRFEGGEAGEEEEERGDTYPAGPSDKKEQV